jgi:predicted MFS family arabinose efflux permease
MLGGFAADHLDWRTPFWGITVLFALTAAFLMRMNGGLPARAKASSPSHGSSMARMTSEFRLVLALPWARVVVLTVFAEGAFLYGAFAYIVSHLHQTHGVALALASQVAMLFGFGGMLFALGARYLVGRLGEGGLVLWGGLLVAVSFVVVATGAQWWYSIPACFFAGLGFYMLHNTLQINATQMAPERRGAAVAAFAAAFFTGQSVGIAVDGVLIDRIGTSGAIGVGAAGVLLLSLNFSRMLRARNQLGAVLNSQGANASNTRRG